MNIYNIELIQAINDWQAGGIGLNKTQLSDEIKKHSKSLPDKFKSLSQTCYRRIDLTGKYSLQIGLKLTLTESISSWTFDKEVAKTFNEGVPSKEYTGVIFKINPDDTHFEVILNLDALFRDNDFVSTYERYRDYISNYENGIGRFLNSEKEIILDISELQLNQIWAYGGFSSSIEKIGKMYFEHEPNDDELEQLKDLLKNKKIELKGRWITGEAKDRIVNKHTELAHYVNSKINK